MQIQFLNSPDFTINADGKLERSGSWLLSSDDTDGEITGLAEEWAGSINDPWRIPSADGSSYTPDPVLKVQHIECKALDSRHCRIKFTASTTSPTGGEMPEAITGSFRFERKNDLTEYKIISYKLPQNDLSLLPPSGSIIDWAGSDYRCEAVTVQENSNQLFTAEIRAVNIAIELAGRIKSEKNHDEEFKIGSWQIMPDALEDFLQNNILHTPAVWAGENFYIYKIATEPADSATRTQVTLTARRSKLEMLEALRSEEIVAMPMDIPDKRLVWQSRWRATAEDREIFENKLGNTAEDWTNDDQMVVCKITPKRISDCEFEYLLEARYPEDIGREYNFDSRDLDLPDRHEYYTRVGEIRLSASQCGYTWRHNGIYRAITNWLPAQLCPLVTTMPLAQRWINQPVKVLEIVEVSFLAGTSAKNISQIISWFTSQRVSNTTIAGISGSFLRYDLEIDDITDSYNRDWTRISRVYRKSPDNYDWNSTYWL
ncbi:MAG: hypothetical protein E7039_08680 [Lentisphaerae bacterium]|nr:hypothetical protein [Lentisphaerota bacterium]